MLGQELHLKDIVVVVISDFRNTDGNNLSKEQIQLNYDGIKQDVKEIVSSEMGWIKNDSNLKYLVRRWIEETKKTTTLHLHP